MTVNVGDVIVWRVVDFHNGFEPVIDAGTLGLVTDVVLDAEIKLIAVTVVLNDARVIKRSFFVDGIATWVKVVT